MERFIRYLVTGDGHKHKWSVHFASGVWCTMKQYHCRCEVCGKVKAFNMS